MYHARWSIDLVNRTRQKTANRPKNESTLASKMKKPKSITDLVLEQKHKAEQLLNVDEA